MSDRIAVFNHGPIEQISPPVELYEHPATEFVAGFVGVSNMLERAGDRFTIRPEKIQLLDAGHPPNGLRTERGRIAEVAYAGMVTRYTVALEDGGELQLVRQNAEATAPDAATEQGREVAGGLAPGVHGRGPCQIQHRGGITVRTKDAHPARTAWIVIAGLLAFMLLLAGCGSSSGGESSGGEELTKLGKGEGAGQPDLLGRLRRTRMGEAVRKEDRLQGQRQGSRDLRRNGRS